MEYKFKPIIAHDSEFKPLAPQGEWVVWIASYTLFEERHRLLVSFTNGSAKIPLWIHLPNERYGVAGSLYWLKKIAEALGSDAARQYVSVDEDGFSRFDLADWYGVPLLVSVNEMGVDAIKRAPIENRQPPQEKADGR